MPIIKRFAFCVLRINLKDHYPPHFHVVMNDGREALVKIDGQEVIHSEVSLRELAEVLAWAQSNESLLLSKFEEYRQ